MLLKKYTTDQHRDNGIFWDVDDFANYNKLINALKVLR